LNTIVKTIEDFYGPNPKDSKMLNKIVNQSHSNEH